MASKTATKLIAESGACDLRDEMGGLGIMGIMGGIFPILRRRSTAHDCRIDIRNSNGAPRAAGIASGLGRRHVHGFRL